MADTSPVVERPANNEPVIREKGERAKVDTKSFIGGFLLLIIILLSLITIVSGRWMKSHRDLAGDFKEISLWDTCSCSDAWEVSDMGKCSKYKSLILAVEGFSIIALGFEFFTVIILYKDPTNESKGLGHLATFFAIMGWISLLLTWAIFGGAYSKWFCYQRMRDFAQLGWGYGVRCGECGLWFILMSLLIAQSLGKIKRNRAVVFFAFIIFALGIITTTGRGWIKARPERLPANVPIHLEGGLWENCVCTSNLLMTCRRRVHLVRAAEVFACTSIVLSSFLLVLFSGWIPATPRSVGITVALAAWASQLLTWICFGSFYSRQYCHTRYRNGVDGYKLHWAFGLQVALSGLMIPVVIIAFIREYMI